MSASQTLHDAPIRAYQRLLRVLNGQQENLPNSTLGVGDIERDVRLWNGWGLGNSIARRRNRGHWAERRSRRLRRNWNGYSEDGTVLNDVDVRDQEGASGGGKQGTKAQLAKHDGKDKQRQNLTMELMKKSKVDGNEGREETKGVGSEVY
jgi:hypothetical protein